MANDTPREPGEGDRPEVPRPVTDPAYAAKLIALERSLPYGSRAAHRGELAQLPDRRKALADVSAVDETAWAYAKADADRPEKDRIHLTDKRIDHILVGDRDKDTGGHRHGSAIPDKSTFPQDWDDETILATVVDVARNPDLPPIYQKSRRTWLVEGWRDDVHIVAVVQPDGEIRTGYPLEGRGVHRNDKTGRPIQLPWPHKE